MLIDYDRIPYLGIGTTTYETIILKQMLKNNVLPSHKMTVAEELCKEIAWFHHLMDCNLIEYIPLMFSSDLLNLPLLETNYNLREIESYFFNPYYKVRLTQVGAIMAQGLSKNNELPFPILPVNGSICFFERATAIPPHNLDEIVTAIIALLDFPNMSDDDLLQILKGPDFPNGGIIYEKEALRSFYLTGKGNVVLHPHYEETTIWGDKAVVITQLPYLLGIDEVLYTLHRERESKSELIRDVRDYSDQSGDKILVFPKRRVKTADLIKWLDGKLTREYPLTVTVLHNDEIKIV